jgi:magnesium transporter
LENPDVVSMSGFFIFTKTFNMSSHHKEHSFKNFTWIDILNPDKGQITELSAQYNLDFFQIKDSLEIGHLPKIENYADYSFIILRAFTGNMAERQTNINKLTNKVAFFVSEKRLITIRRAKFHFFDEVEQDFQQVEELLIYLMRKMVRSYDDPIAFLAKKVEMLEHSVFVRSNHKISLEDLYYHKAQSRIAKKVLQYSQTVVNQIVVKDKIKPSLQDIKDQVLGLIHNCDEVIDDTNNLLNTYLSINAQKSNDVMKLLTVFSAFFLPLTFIVGVYGMNFDYMPELRHEYGYFAVMGLMLLIVIWIYIWFRRRKIL